MASILDDFPYPFNRPEAGQLQSTLVELFPVPMDIQFILQKAQMPTDRIYFNQPPHYIWYSVLTEAAKNGMVRPVVEAATSLVNPRNPRHPFLQKLLADKPVQIEAELGIAGEAPSFNDSISEPEALLYHDDLTMQIGRVPALIKTLELLVELAPAVCRLTIDINGLNQTGTAFRIGPDLLLTNWHVLHRTTNGVTVPASAVTAEFGYEDDGKGGVLSVKNIKCDPASIKTNKDDDWGIITTTQPLDPAWPIIKLSEAVAPVPNSSAYIIQHPLGERKRLGFIRNQVSEINDRAILYLTDTQVGSSGSPVFDEKGKLIALHHQGGRPQQVVGKPPIKKNEGIRISKVLAGITVMGVSVP
jgi:hypothetical protein